jgi:hypothetical protein
MLEPGVGFRVSVRDDLYSHRVPAICDGTGDWILRCDVEQSGPSESSDGWPIRIRVRQSHAGIVCYISADVKWQPHNIRHRDPIGEPLTHTPNLTRRGSRCNGREPPVRVAHGTLQASLGDPLPGVWRRGSMSELWSVRPGRTFWMLGVFALFAPVFVPLPH